LSAVSSLKFDAALAAAVSRMDPSETDPLLDVSVRTRQPISDEQAAELRAIGVAGATAERQIFPARISHDALHRIADKPWVAYVSLAQELRPLTTEQAG
jgi:hypothetical protein